jgi:dTDP-4-amino-4,6-dideoxygalactose transaminase
MNVHHNVEKLEQHVAQVWPYFDEEQIADVVEVLRSGKVNAWTGAKVREFEETYAAMVGRKYGLALANGSISLDVALHALELQPGDEVIVTPRSFVASASCVPLAGATPVFADVDPWSQAITADSIAAVLTPRTRAVIVVHLAGWPAEMDAIMQLANHHGIIVIEDCAQAHGAEYRGRPVGSFGHIASFSFCQDKILTTGGEGGLLLMDDETIWARAWRLRDHGKARDLIYQQSSTPGFRWLISSFGSNYRMTEIQAAIGLRQLRRLPIWLSQRQANAAVLLNAFRKLDALRTPEPPPHISHAWYRAYTFVRPEQLKRGWNRQRIMEAIILQGVPCFTGSCPEIYREKAFVEAGFQPASPLPNAAALGETSLAFLVDPCQTRASMMRVAEVVTAVVREASKAPNLRVGRVRAVSGGKIQWVGTRRNASDRAGVLGR